MLSSSNIESLIAAKRREIEIEKTVLGLSVPREQVLEDVEENLAISNKQVPKQVNFAKSVPCDRNELSEEKENFRETHEDFEEKIPPDLERYIRRYVGLPVMLKAGEYSPNNPLVRGERAPGDVLLGLGEYERRRNTLRKIQQQQYREYLDEQAKKKQEAKQQAERERREKEQKEKEREERQRVLLEERERCSVERRRSVQYVPISESSESSFSSKVDTGVQVDGGFRRPLSVAVQTDETELFRLSPPPNKCQLTQAERELSPRSVADAARAWPGAPWSDSTERRRSYGDFDERASSIVTKSNRDKLTSDLRHTYMPSIFDADAIRLRNIQAEKEAAERRQYYQQELKNQILEQQRIREERKSREKMLEQAEMRRLEEQLRMLRVAQEREVGRQHEISAAMKESTSYYNNQRAEFQREIDVDRQKLLRAVSQPMHTRFKRNTNTSKSEIMPSNLPFYYPRVNERSNEIADKKPYSTNIPDNSIFSENYDVDSYLRKNLNFNKQKATITQEKDTPTEAIPVSVTNTAESQQTNEDIRVDKAIGHDRPEERIKIDRPVENVTENGPSYKNVETIMIAEPSRTKKFENVDTLPIPVLRHSPKRQESVDDDTKMSEAMKKVDDKWKVPAVQKNILKALPNEEGKNVNILTQLGSIRRQLQLEQLKLDRMVTKHDDDDV